MSGRVAHSSAISAEKPLQVLLIGLPRVLTDIVRETVITQPDIRLRVEPPHAGREPDAANVARRARPDAVILGTDLHELDAGWEEVFRECPRMRVLTVLRGGRESFLYELRPTRTPLGELSPKTLIDALRPVGQRTA